MKELALNHLPELAPRTVESLNLLRLRLEQTAPDAKIILLTSTTPQEGKTTLALQFWRLLAGLIVQKRQRIVPLGKFSAG